VECQFRLIDYRGDELFTMTPLMGMSWMFERIYEPFQKGLMPDALIVEVDMDDNPHLDEATKNRVLAGLSPEERAARKAGRFVHFAGLIYPEFGPDMIAPEWEEVPSDAMVICGIDPGFRHMAAAVFCAVLPDGSWVVFDEVALQQKTIREVCEELKLRSVKWGRTPRWYVIDPASRNRNAQTGRSDQMEYADYGIVTIAGQNSVSAGLQRVRGLLTEGRLSICANCTETITQFRKYRWSTPKRVEDDAREAPVKKDDHLLDALRYAVMSRPRVEVPGIQERVPMTVRLVQQDLDNVGNDVPRGSFGPGQFV
jgi:hypothetical protein